jgi:hypothetical protein
MTNNAFYAPTNKNAIIRTRTTRNNKIRTETARRDAYTFNAAAVTTPRTEGTVVYLDLPNGDTVQLNGRQARTLYRLLEKHFSETGKPIGF